MRVKNANIYRQFLRIIRPPRANAWHEERHERRASDERGDTSKCALHNRRTSRRFVILPRSCNGTKRGTKSTSTSAVFAHRAKRFQEPFRSRPPAGDYWIAKRGAR